MSFYPTSGTQGNTKHQPWDLMAQQQLEFQKSIANRKSVRGKGWRKELLRHDFSLSPNRGYSVPMAPGGHRWAHYLRPPELQAWRDHLSKGSRDVEGPLRCDDIGLWGELFSRIPSPRIAVKTLASSDGQRLLAELKVASSRASLDSVPDQSTIQASAWTSSSVSVHKVANSAPRGSGTGQVRPSPGSQKIGPDRGLRTIGTSVSSGASTAAGGLGYWADGRFGVVLEGMRPALEGQHWTYRKAGPMQLVGVAKNWW